MSLERPNLSGVAEKTDGNFLATLFKDILKGRRSEYQVRAKSYFLNDIDMEELRWVDRYGLIIFLMPSLQAIFIERKDKLYADD